MILTILDIYTFPLSCCFLGRNGDFYAAMRDVEKVLLLCPMHKKAHMRRLRLMHALGWYEEGSRLVRKFQALFPGETEFSDKMRLDCDKAAALESKFWYCGVNFCSHNE